MFEHFGISLCNGANYTYNPKNQNNTGILDHINQKLTCNGDLDSFQIIGGAKNDFYLCLKESLLIPKLKPIPEAVSIELLPSGSLVDNMQGMTEFGTINPGQTVESNYPVEVYINGNTIN